MPDGLTAAEVKLLRIILDMPRHEHRAVIVGGYFADHGWDALVDLFSRVIGLTDTRRLQAALSLAEKSARSKHGTEKANA